MRHPLRYLAFAGLLFLASGTLLRGSRSDDAEAVEATLRRHVEPGVTQVQQIIDRFGEPATRAARRGPGVSEVLGYNHESVAPSGFPIVPLLSFARHDPADTFFEITDGVVTRYWTAM